MSAARRRVLSLAVAAACGMFAAASQAAQIVRLDQTNLNLLPGGKEVDAIFGDYVLKNDKVVAVVGSANPNRHANLTTTNVQGAVIDFALLATNNDQLSAYQPHAYVGVTPKDAFPVNGAYNNPGPAADKIEIIKADGAEVTLRVTRKPTDEYPIEVVTTYTLKDGDQHLRAVTTRKNTSDKAFTVRLTQRLKHEKPALFSASGPHSVIASFDRHFGAAYGVVRTDGRPLNVPGAPASPAQAKGSAGLFDFADLSTAKGPGSVELAAGKTAETSVLLIAGTDLADVQRQAISLLQAKVAGAAVTVKQGEKPAGGVCVSAFTTDAWNKAADRTARRAITPISTGFTAADGSIMLPLPAGNYVIVAEQPGSAAQSTTVEWVAWADGQPASVNLSIDAPAAVAFDVTDGQGVDSPVKVQFVGMGTTPNPDLGPDQRADGCRNLYFSVKGKFSVPLPPGEYTVLLSRGPEFDAAYRTIKLTAGQTAKVSARLPRVVDTAGWVSTDFHNHSTLSGDNSTQVEGRLAALIAEGVEFCPATEHQRLTSYKAFLKAMGAEKLMGTSDGMELTGTPLPLDHQNAFPLHAHPHTQYGGGPEITKDPLEQIKRLKNHDGGAEKLLQQNHPDLGWLVFDRDGDGKPDDGYGTLSYTDVMEIFETHDVLSMKPIRKRSGNTENNRFFNWLQLLNRGHRIPGVANTDAHHCFHDSGTIRNWVVSSTDDPAAVNEMEMVRASKKGAMIMSSGPFMTVTANGGAGPGDEIKSQAGEPVQLKVRVQCPNWFTIDRVQILVNGRADAALTFTRATHPKLFADGVVKFDQTIPVKLPADAHLIVVAVDEHGTTGPIMGAGELPIAISNPIWVDVGADGFKNSNDTLDHPLPVKSRQ